MIYVKKFLGGAVDAVFDKAYRFWEGENNVAAYGSMHWAGTDLKQLLESEELNQRAIAGKVKQILRIAKWTIPDSIPEVASRSLSLVGNDERLSIPLRLMAAEGLEGLLKDRDITLWFTEEFPGLDKHRQFEI